ncbi:MAG: ribonuclease III domain-containing protein [Clostridia bacterium]
MTDNIPVLNSVIPKSEAVNQNPLVLAFIGDSVQQLYVRTKLVVGSTKKTGELHKLAIREIKAVAQAETLDHLLPLFNDDEMAIYKRARNSKANTIAKNASVADYKKASGFEAVLGYLYLIGEHDRLNELLSYKPEEIL